MDNVDSSPEDLSQENARLKRENARLREGSGRRSRVRRLQQVRGPVGWLHRHDVVARLLFLVAALGSGVLSGTAVQNGAGDALIYALLALSVLFLLLMVWFAIYAGDFTLF